jgi:soluble lytic murein transglycosylase-like protein
VFLAGLALLVAAGWLEGPVVARQVYALVGVRRVEAHAEVLREAALESGVDVHLLAGLVYVESRGRVDARSSAGAMGLFQLMPAAASDAAARLGLPPPTEAELLSDARLSARLGANHLRRLHQLLGPDPERILVAYNAGRSRLLGWEKDAGGWAAWRDRHARANDSPTLAYAQDVLLIAERFRERGVLAPAPAATGVHARDGAGPAPAPGGAPPAPGPRPAVPAPGDGEPPAPSDGSRGSEVPSRS